MAHFDLSTDLGSGSIPRPGITAFHGPATTGPAAVQRNLIQFMNGAPIVDYGSIAVNTPGGANGTVKAIDSRAGDQINTPTTGTSGFTPHVVETWTATFQTATTYDLVGAVSGSQGTFNTGVDAIVKDLIYIRIDAGTSIDWALNDTVTFDFVNNPNNSVSSPGTQWTDPDPFKGYLENGQDQPIGEDAGNTSYPDKRNYRPIFIDAGGIAQQSDFVYMAFAYYEEDGDYSLWIQGMTGYDEGGNNPNPSNGVYLFLEHGGEIFGHFVCDQYYMACPLYMDGEWNFGYAGLVDPFRTTDEFSYPFHCFGNSDTPGAWSANSTTKHSLVDADALDCGDLFSPEGIWTGTRNYSTNASNEEVNVDMKVRDPICINYSTVSYPFFQGNVSTYYGPPRAGDAQVPLIPISVRNMSWTSRPVIGDNPNSYDQSYSHGEMRGVYASPIANTSEGDIVQISGTDYITLRGRFGTMATSDRFFRLAFRLL